MVISKGGHAVKRISDGSRSNYNFVSVNKKGLERSGTIRSFVKECAASRFCRESDNAGLCPVYRELGRFAVLLKSALLLDSAKKVTMPGCAHSKEYRKCAPTPRNTESAQFKDMVYLAKLTLVAQV